MRVAVRVAVPPNWAVPETALRTVGAVVTVKFPEAVPEPASSVSPANVATTAEVSTPTAELSEMPVTVATPLEFVTALPAEVPSRVNDTILPGTVAPEELSRVATKVAGPPNAAVPETAASAVDCWLTTRLPLEVVLASSVLPANEATTPLVSVPTASVVATLGSVAIPLPSVTAVPTETPSRVKATGWSANPALVASEVSVAVRVAVPPKVAVPPTPENAVEAWATSSVPVALAAAA